MSGKLAIGGLAAVAVMALSAGTASAHPPGYGGGYYRPVVYQPVYQPVYRPVYTAPFYQPQYTTPIYPSVYGGGLYSRPVYGGGFGGYPVYGGSFGTVGIGVYRPGFGLNLGFVIR